MSEQVPPKSGQPEAGKKAADAGPDAAGGTPAKKAEAAPKPGGAGAARSAKPKPKPEPKSEPKSDQTERVRPRVLPWVVALLMLLILGSAGGAWYWWSKLYVPAMAQLDQKLDALDSASAASSQKLQALESAGQQASKAVGRLQRQQETLDGLVDKLQRMQNRSSDDWILAEAQYLLTVASERLGISRDVDSAIAAMQDADERLRDLANPGLIPVREQIVHDLSSLRAVQRVDINGMALYLADLSGRVSKLPLKDQTPLLEHEPGAAPKKPQIHNWRELVESIWHDLRRLVVIREKTPSGVALLQPEHRLYLFENLRLELASARLAVLRRDSANVQASLDMVSRWLKRYFDTRSSAVSSVLDRLANISRADLKPALPDISGALDALEQYRRSHRPAGAAATTAQGSAAQ